MDLDIIIFAIIAVVIFMRLWTVFGRRNDNEPQRPNPFTPPPRPQEDDASFRAKPIPQKEVGLLPSPVFKAAPASLAGALEQIKAQDPSFDEKGFLQGARVAFTMIVEDFAKSDMSRIDRLLGPEVLKHFQNAIDMRREAGQTMESKILRIIDTETASARLDDTNARITVRFISEQVNILRDKAMQIIGGEVGKSEMVTDLWTFGRDTKSANPNWLLVETSV